MLVEKSSDQIIAVKPDGATWGTSERKGGDLIVVKVKFDAITEAEIQAEKRRDWHRFCDQSGRPVRKANWKRIQQINSLPAQAMADDRQNIYEITYENNPVIPASP
jgi:hypothetical protein